MLKARAIARLLVPEEVPMCSFVVQMRNLLLRAVGGLMLMLSPVWVSAQSEPIFQSIGADTPLSFAHLSLPGAIGINFRFAGGFAPAYPDTESHTVVLVFEWGPSAAGPWSISPDFVKSVPGGTTAFFDTGVYPGPADAPWVRLHFYAGGLMTAAGTFEHVSVVPEPTPGSLWWAGLAGLVLASRVRRAGVS